MVLRSRAAAVMHFPASGIRLLVPLATSLASSREVVHPGQPHCLVPVIVNTGLVASEDG